MCSIRGQNGVISPKATPSPDKNDRRLGRLILRHQLRGLYRLFYPTDRTCSSALVIGWLGT